MQAQFKQFVKDNQGKLIQFLHNGVFVSKFVADIQREYFTCNSTTFDSRIDGFYYFSDCKIHEHPLISVLDKHKITVLNLSTGNSVMFKYTLYCFGKLNGTCLTSSQPLSFHIDSIKDVWSIVDGKYTKVYPLQEATYNTVESALRDHKNVVLGYSKMVVPTSITKIDETFIYGICPLIGSETQHQLSAIKNIFTIVNGEWKCIYTQDTTSSPMNKLATYFEGQNKDKEEDINYKYPGILSGRAYTRYPSGKVKTDTFYKDGKFHGDYKEYHENGNIKTKAFYQDGTLNGDYYEYFKDGSCSKFIEYKNGLKNGVYIEYGRNDKGFQISSHRHFKDDIDVKE